MGVLDRYDRDRGNVPYEYTLVPDYRMIPGLADSDAADLLGCILHTTEEYNGRWICLSNNEELQARSRKEHRRIFQGRMYALKACGAIRRVQDDADPWNGHIEVLWRPPDELIVDDQPA